MTKNGWKSLNAKNCDMYVQKSKKTKKRKKWDENIDGKSWKLRKSSKFS